MSITIASAKLLETVKLWQSWKIIGIRWKKNQVSFLVPSRLLPLSFSFPYANIDHEDAVLPTELKHSSMVVDNPQCFCFI
jgi:hypothetical protein